MTHYTPLQDYAGIITPARLHFVQQHSSDFPEIDANEHRLTVHGMVDRPLSFTMDDLKSCRPSPGFISWSAMPTALPRSTMPAIQNMGLPVQYIHGMASCSEWSGVPLSVLLNEAGVQKEGTWLVLEGGDPGKFSHTLPLAKAMDDCLRGLWPERRAVAASSRATRSG